MQQANVNSNGCTGIRRAQACEADAREAARQFHAAVAQPNLALVIFFCSSKYDLAALGEEMRRLFDGVEVIGCTTAGEIGPDGWREHSISGASFAADTFTVATGRIDDLRQFDAGAGKSLVQDLLHRVDSRAAAIDSHNSFGFLLVDGLCGREDQITRTLQSALGTISLFGGSAGASLNSAETFVYCGGHFRSDRAVLAIVNTRLPFRLFMAQHFVTAEPAVVITAVDEEARIVREIDGWPAAKAYASLLGTGVQELDATRFAASPMVVAIGGANYVRSIRKANPDGSLSFFCAIDEGMVLRVAHAANLADNLEREFGAVRAAIGKPQLVIGCDCFLRRLEAQRNRLDSRIQGIFIDNNVVGFDSFGEQFRGVHVNQTFTAVAIGALDQDSRRA